MIVANFTPAPARIAGPRIVRIDHPSQVDYAVGVGAATDAPDLRPACPAGYRRITDRYGEEAIVPDYRNHPRQPLIIGKPLPADLKTMGTAPASAEGHAVTLVGICALYDHLFGSDRSAQNGDYLARLVAQNAAVLAFANKHKASLYGADRSTYCDLDGIDMARAEGRAVVICEDLS